MFKSFENAFKSLNYFLALKLVLDLYASNYDTSTVWMACWLITLEYLSSINLVDINMITTKLFDDTTQWN